MVTSARHLFDATESIDLFIWNLSMTENKKHVPPDDPQTRELVRWVMRLSKALRVGLPRSVYPDEAMTWLIGQGLIAPPLDASARMKRLDFISTTARYKPCGKQQ